MPSSCSSLYLKNMPPTLRYKTTCLKSKWKGDLIKCLLQICELTCSALSTLLLRNSESSQQLYALEVHRILVQLLSIHTKNPKLIVICIWKKPILKNDFNFNYYFDRNRVVWHFATQFRGIVIWATNLSSCESKRFCARSWATTRTSNATTRWTRCCVTSAATAISRSFGPERAKTWPKIKTALNFLSRQFSNLSMTCRPQLFKFQHLFFYLYFFIRFKI